MQLSFRTTLRSPPSWCSITTVRSNTARTRTCLPSTIALQPPLTWRLAGGFPAAPSRWLAGEVPDAQLPGVDKPAPAVDQHLRLARGGLDHSGALEYRSHPDAASIVYLRLEVREDLVVLVHGNAVQA